MRRRTGRHLDDETLLDYLEERADAAARRRVEEHLAGACTACRERLDAVAKVLAAMRADRVPEVPASVRARALESFDARPIEVAPESHAMRIARLVFDSLRTPLAAGARRSVGETQRLRWEFPAGGLELEIEQDGPGRQTVRGHLERADPALCRIEIEAAGETRSAWPDAAGLFVLEDLPADPIRWRVVTSEDTFVSPDPEP